MNARTIILSIILISTAMLTACVDFEPVSEVPTVKFVDFRTGIIDADGSLIPYGEIEFEFTDGNADFGISGVNTNNDSLADTIRFNLFLVPLTKVDSVTYIPAEPDGKTLGQTIFYDDKMSREGQYRVINGNVTYRLLFTDLPVYTLDTFRYQFYIYDRAFNKSIPDTTFDLCYKHLVK